MSKINIKPFPLWTKRDIVLILFILCISLFLLMPTILGIQRHVLAITYLSIFLEALCFMLIGSVVSGVVEEFVPRNFLERLMFKKQIAVVASSAAMGFVFPICECAIIPVVRRLLKKGLPLSAGIAFMLAAPIVNPVVIWSTSVAYQGQWFVVISRFFLGYSIALLVAIVAGKFFNSDKALIPEVSESPCGYDCEHNHDEITKLYHASYQFKRNYYRIYWQRIIRSIQHARDDFFDVVPYLVIGTFSAALIRSLIAASTIQDLTNIPFFSIGGMMGLAFVLNLCSEADAFVAVSFNSIISLAGQMSFMVFGPMLDIKLLFMYRLVFRNRFIVFLAGSIIVLVALFMVLFHLIVNRAVQ